MILEAMKGSDAIEYTFKKDRVVVMRTKPLDIVDGKSIDVNPQLLFQPLLAAAGGMVEYMADIFRYELWWCGAQLSN